MRDDRMQLYSLKQANDKSVRGTVAQRLAIAT